MIKPYKVCYLIVFTLLCCKKPYNPSIISSPNSYLVVEGVINSGNDSTIIKLSKTVNLSGQTTLNPILGATVFITSDQGNQFFLTDEGNGNYSSAPLNLPASQKYQLAINIDPTHQYQSDFVAVKPTSPIDSIGYIVQGNGLQLYVNTHDPANSSRYYRWDYAETWIFHSKYESVWVADPNTNTIVLRNANQGIYYCFGNSISSNILLASTTKLKQDIVYQSPLTQIPFTSEKLEVKYSILVRQYALTDKAYAFYQNMQKNTEQLGSIFDAQPTQLNGNIHNTQSPNEPVIGYVSVTNVQSKRVFILGSVVPSNVRTIYPYDCQQDTAVYFNKQGYNDVQNILINPPYTEIPTQALFTPFGGIYGYLFSTTDCVDCTLRGTTQIPSFWK